MAKLTLLTLNRTEIRLLVAWQWVEAQFMVVIFAGYDWSNNHKFLEMLIQNNHNDCCSSHIGLIWLV